MHKRQCEFTALRQARGSSLRGYESRRQLQRIGSTVLVPRVCKLLQPSKCERHRPRIERAVAFAAVLDKFQEMAVAYETFWANWLVGSHHHTVQH